MTSTTGGDFKAIKLTWSEDFGGLCKLEGSKAEKSMIGSCANNDRFLVGQKGNSKSSSVGALRKKRTTEPQDTGVEDMILYIKFSVTKCGVYKAEKDNNFPFKFDYSTFFFEGKGRSQKKTGLCGENSQTGGAGGLTQAHFLMFIYQVIFGMPK